MRLLDGRVHLGLLGVARAHSIVFSQEVVHSKAQHGSGALAAADMNSDGLVDIASGRPRGPEDVGSLCDVCPA